jgi:hypothetical protein
MSHEEKEQSVQLDEFRDEAFFEASFRYWFDNEGERESPFPASIRDSLKVLARDRFLEFLNDLEQRVEEEDLSDEEEATDYDEKMLVEKFEEYLFGLAMKMVETEEERITLSYPFMPRPGEQVRESDGKALSTVKTRKIVREGDEKFMEVHCERDDGSEWSTRFELPG